MESHGIWKAQKSTNPVIGSDDVNSPITKRVETVKKVEDPVVKKSCVRNAGSEQVKVKILAQLIFKKA